MFGLALNEFHFPEGRRRMNANIKNVERKNIKNREKKEPTICKENLFSLIINGFSFFSSPPRTYIIRKVDYYR